MNINDTVVRAEFNTVNVEVILTWEHLSKTGLKINLGMNQMMSKD